MSRAKQFFDGAARAFYVEAYMTAAENDDTWLMPTPGPGADWNDCAPETHPLAYVYAGELIRDLEFASPWGLLGLADAAEGCEVSAYELGWCLAMQAMGHGVAWEDNHKSFERKRASVWPDPGLLGIWDL